MVTGVTSLKTLSTSLHREHCSFDYSADRLHTIFRRCNFQDSVLENSVLQAHTHAPTHTHTYTHTHTHTRTHTHTHEHLHTHAHIHTYTHTCIQYAYSRIPPLSALHKILIHLLSPPLAVALCMTSSPYLDYKQRLF